MDPVTTISATAGIKKTLKVADFHMDSTPASIGPDLKPRIQITLPPQDAVCSPKSKDNRNKEQRTRRHICTPMHYTWYSSENKSSEKLPQTPKTRLCLRPKQKHATPKTWTLIQTKPP